MGEHGLELPPLQLPYLPAAADAANVASAVGAVLEANLTAEPADAPGVPELIVIDGGESASDGISSDDDSGDKSRIEEEGGGAGAGDEPVEL